MSIEVVTNPSSSSEDSSLDISLRPQQLSDYIGQSTIKKNLHILLEAAKKRGEPVEHILLHGSPGLGKTTLAHIIAREMNTNIRITSGPAIERTGDLAAILTNLQEGDILFIDEIHRLHKTIEEMLYPAMEDFALDVIAGKGPAARTLRLDVPKFTIIGATTRMSLISAPLRDRFGVHYKLNFYTDDEMKDIVMRSATILNITIDDACAGTIANRSRKTPRIANRLLKRARDYAEVHNNGMLDVASAVAALELLEVDAVGLDDVDRKILTTIAEKFNGGPVGVQTIAAATAEERETIEDIHEPFLMQAGYLARTPRGRILTAHGYEHIGMTPPANQEQLGI